MGGGASVEQPGPRAGRGRVRVRGGARDDGDVPEELVVCGGRRVGGRGGGGIRVDADGCAGTGSPPFGVEMLGVDTGADRDNDGTGMLGTTAKAFGVV